MFGRRSFLIACGFWTCSLFQRLQAKAGPLRTRRRCCRPKPADGLPPSTSTPERPAAPHPATGPKQGEAFFIQPSYERWRTLKVGMNENEVLELLGPPLERETEASVIKGLIADGMTKAEATEFFHSPDTNYMLTWLYGRIRFDAPMVPGEFTFYLYFLDGKLDSFGDPFGGRLSPDGIPTMPMLAVPVDKTTFEHFPRFVDLRWTPSSGEYPVSYEIEWATGRHEDDDAGGSRVTYFGETTLHSQIPYAILEFGGANPGRWRVRAKNRLGTSDWSPYRHFEFEI